MGQYNRLPFSLSYLFVATRDFLLNGVELTAGADIDDTGMSAHRMRQLYEGRKIAVKVDDKGNPILRGSVTVETATDAATTTETDPNADIVLQPGEAVGNLAGVVDADGKLLELLALPEAELRAIATSMEIEGADTLSVEELATKIQAEPVIALLEEGTDDANKGEPAKQEGASGDAGNANGENAGGDSTDAGNAAKEPAEPPVKAEEEKPAPRYHAEHRGSGRWYVIDATTKEPVSAALKKDEALKLAAEKNA